MTARVLYLSYDGMTDPLGRSQVLPYLTGLAALGHEITLVSFEKPGRSAEERERVEAICGEAGIAWHPLRYHKRPPILSSVWDVVAMRRAAARLPGAGAGDTDPCGNGTWRGPLRFAGPVRAAGRYGWRTAQQGFSKESWSRPR